ncbi:MAG: FG-GAP repeat domain-containing protein [Bdellovibrio sp.]
MRNSLKSIIGLSSTILIILFFQNCSKVHFTESSVSLASQSAAPSGLSPVPETKCNMMTADAVKPKLKYAWSPTEYADFNQVMSSPSVADIDGDGQTEIVFVTFTQNSNEWFPDTIQNLPLHMRNGVLRVINGADGSSKFSIQSSELAPLGDTTPLVVDIDGDGKAEIIYPHYSRTKIIALNSDGSKRWIYDLPQGLNTCSMGLSTADLNNDGIADIMVGNIVISEGKGTRIPYQLLALAPQPNIFCGTYAKSLTNSKELNIVTNEGLYKSDGTKIATFNDGAGTTSTVSQFHAVADILPENPGLEIVSAGNGKLFIRSATDGSILKSVDLSIYNDLKCSNGLIGGGFPTVGDFDGNPDTIEIAVATGQYLTILDSNLKMIAQSKTQDCSSLVTGITSFDFNGDKKPEILYSDEEYFRIFEISNGSLNEIFKTPNPSGTLFEYPVVADVDGKPGAEIVVASNNYAAPYFYLDPEDQQYAAEGRAITGLRVFESSEQNAWMPTGNTWNQYHFNVDLVSKGVRPVAFTAIDGAASKYFRRNSQNAVFEPVCK